MKNDRGFTLVELIITLVIGVLLTSIAVTAFADVQTRMSVRSARATLTSLHARTRAHAIEYGDKAYLNVSTVGDSVWVTRGGGTVERLDFRSEFGVNIVGSLDSYQLCMTSRGFADDNCNSWGKGSVKLAFTLGGDTARVEILPLGQLIW